MGPVQLAQVAGEAGQLHAVVLLKAHADPGGGQLDVGSRDRHPHGGRFRPFLQHRHFRIAGVQPHISVAGIIRRGVGNVIGAVLGAVLPAQLYHDIGGYGHAGLQAALVGQVLGVQVLLVRPDHKVRAHRDELLDAGRQAHLDGIPVVDDVAAADDGQRVLGDQAARRRDRVAGGARLPRPQDRILAGAHVLLVVELVVLDAEVVVVAAEHVDELLIAGKVVGFPPFPELKNREIHAPTPCPSASGGLPDPPAYACGCTSGCRRCTPR